MDELKKNLTLIIACAAIIVFTLLMVTLFNRNQIDEEFLASDNAFLRNYGVNEAIPITVTQEQMARSYLAEYVHLMMNNPQRAYELLAEDYREAVFPTFEDFYEYLGFMRNERFFRATLDRFEVVHSGEYRIYNVVDVAGNTFVFRVRGVFDYTVMLDNHTIVN